MTNKMQTCPRKQVNMALMVILVFVIADSENQVCYKKVNKALSVTLEEGNDHVWGDSDPFSCWWNPPPPPHTHTLLWEKSVNIIKSNTIKFKDHIT